MFTDLAGFSREVEKYSMLSIFRNPFKSLRAAIDMQKATFEYNKNKIDEEKIHLCVGLCFGDILKIGDLNVFGAEVNASSKLGEDIAKKGEILCTNNFIDTVSKFTNIEYEPIEDIPHGAKRAFKIIYTV